MCQFRGAREICVLFPNVRISTPPNEPALPILILAGPWESSLTAAPGGFWTTETERRKEVGFIVVVDQNSPCLSLPSASSSSCQRHQRTPAVGDKAGRKHDDGETTRQNLRLLYDFFGFFQWIFLSDIYYLAVVRQRGLSRPPETYHPIQVRLFRATSPYKILV